MNTEKTISVAMATFNGEKYIQEQLDSILNQTYLPIEIIICDDCSIDNTWNILNEYSEKHPIIKIYKNNKNLGFKQNFEKAIMLCKGNYIALSDQDDIWLPNHLYSLINNIGENSVACGEAILIDSRGKELGLRLSEQEGLERIPSNDIEKAYFIYYNRGAYQGASMLLKRDFVNIALPIPEGIKFHDVWFSFFACFTNGLKSINENITLYRQHENNASGTHINSITKVGIIKWHLLSKGNLNYRHLMLNPIKELIDLNEEQLDFFNQAELYCKNRSSIIGRVKNVIFEIKNFKVIYGTENTFIKHFFLYLSYLIKNKLKNILKKF